MNKNRFDGLSFRVMETLEKAKGVPLTAREVGERLYTDEYSDQLKDNVIWRVTNSIHALKGKGKIVQHESRGQGGQLTYVLPQRMAFPKKDDTPPVNPVLKPEIAEKIVTKEPEPEKAPPGRAPIIVDGIAEKIEEFISNASAPVVLPEIIAALGHLYGDHFKDRKDMSTAFASHIYRLHQDRRIWRNNVTGRGRGIKFEYFTKKTGKGAPKPAPQPEVKTKRERVVVEVPVGTNADWVKPQQAPVQQPLFRPGARKIEKVQMNIDVPSDLLDTWKATAEQFDVSLTQFVIDAVEFARGYAGEE